MGKELIFTSDDNRSLVEGELKFTVAENFTLTPYYHFFYSDPNY